MVNAPARDPSDFGVAHRAEPATGSVIRLWLLEISADFLKSVEWATSHPSYIQPHKGAKIVSEVEKVMQFARLN